MHYSVCFTLSVFVHYLSYLFGSFDDLVINVGDPQYQDNINVEVIDKDPSYYVGSDVGALQRKTENMSFISKITCAISIIKQLLNTVFPS